MKGTSVIPAPDTIELCPRCRVHVMWVGRCYHCGFKGEGVTYAVVSPTGEFDRTLRHVTPRPKTLEEICEWWRDLGLTSNPGELAAGIHEYYDGWRPPTRLPPPALAEPAQESAAEDVPF